MPNCAIVCEYNPFHTGHKYQLDRVRESNADSILCVMSGNFVQSAMPAFCEKSIRAECALLGGADAVIELPTVYSTASAGYFAEGALKIISAIKNIGSMAMGATADADDILRIADIRIKYQSRYRDKLIEKLHGGISYNSASVATMCELYGEIHPDRHEIGDILCEPNNVLCIEYISAINKYSPAIRPLIIKRYGAAHNDTEAKDGFISATTIRKYANDGSFDIIEKFVPYKRNDIIEWRSKHSPQLELLHKLAVFALKCTEPERFGRLRNCSEGMEYLFKGLSRKSNYADYTESAVCKRYGKKRIDRLMLDCILEIDKDQLDKRFCTRLLACKSGFDFSILPEFVKTQNAEIKKAASSDTDVASVLKVDEKATALFNTITNTDGDYYNYSLIKL